MFIWEQTSWPSLTWDEGSLSAPLAAARHEQGKLLGNMERVGFGLREEAMLQTLTQDAIKTSEIEAENLDTQQVRSSIARRLGINIGVLLQLTATSRALLTECWTLRAKTKSLWRQTVCLPGKAHRFQRS